MKNHNWKSNYSSTLQSEIDKIKDEGHYRVFNNIERKAGQYPKATRHSNGHTEEIDVWCSNDYLGMSQNKEVISAMQLGFNSVKKNCVMAFKSTLNTSNLYKT